MRSAMSIIVSLVFIFPAPFTSLAQMFAHTLRGNVRATANSGPLAAVRIQLERQGMHSGALVGRYVCLRNRQPNQPARGGVTAL